MARRAFLGWEEKGTVLASVRMLPIIFHSLSLPVPLANEERRCQAKKIALGRPGALLKNRPWT